MGRNEEILRDKRGGGGEGLLKQTTFLCLKQTFHALFISNYDLNYVSLSAKRLSFFSLFFSQDNLYFACLVLGNNSV